MILKTLPARFKALPVLFAALIGLFTYFYLFDREALDRPLWGAADKAPGAPKPVHPEKSPDSTIEQTIDSDRAAAAILSASLSAAAEYTTASTLTTLSTLTSTSPSTTLSSTTISSSSSSSSYTNSKSASSSTESLPKGGLKVVLVTASTGTGGFLGIPGLKEMVYENRMSYALRHGYDMMWANITSYNLPDDVPIYWNKIPVLQEAFIRYPDADWIWWMDMDMIIMNSSLSLWDHVLSPEGMERNVVLDSPLNQPGGADSGYRTPKSYNYDDVNFMISSGGWGMNVGNFLMKRSHWSDWLLDLWIEPFYIDHGWTFPENDGWTHMWRHHPIVRKHSVCTNQRALNAYPAYNDLGKHWQPGDHTIHFAGCGSNPRCPKEWEKYWRLKESYEVPASVTKALEDGTAGIENVQKGIGLPIAP